MESLAQLNADFWLITFALLFLFSWVLAIAGLWVFFRAGRDLHRIADALESSGVAGSRLGTGSPALALARHSASDRVVNSAFGR